MEKEMEMEKNNIIIMILNSFVIFNLIILIYLILLFLKNKF